MQWVGLTALGQPRLSEGAQPYLKDKGQGKYFGSQVRAPGSGPEPVPVPDHLNLAPDRRDLGPENGGQVDSLASGPERYNVS